MTRKCCSFSQLAIQALIALISVSKNALSILLLSIDKSALGVQDSEQYIWVGSLNDAGTALADYSHSAGDMGEDFIVAHDDVLSAGDLAGTSFAAPRNLGAAAHTAQVSWSRRLPVKRIAIVGAEDIGEPQTQFTDEENLT